MAKDDVIRKKMFASIASWQASDLSKREWCRTYLCFQKGIPSLKLLD
jgi:hypothetical protein